MRYPAKVVVSKWGGQSGHLVSRDVVTLEYVNIGMKGRAVYTHAFGGTGVKLWALNDGSLLLNHDTERLWADFVVKAAE